jgi:hypothetical protein
MIARRSTFRPSREQLVREPDEKSKGSGMSRKTPCVEHCPCVSVFCLPCSPHRCSCSAVRNQGTLPKLEVDQG